ncbi:MFS transporter [Evansella sp. AB-rgal1]|uniref:MFS transporter n=1 Tax=Evansella sp. AB-rgal1 TaxID=3242696 RepID=UPI00359E235C
MNDFGWSRSQVSGLYSAATLVAGCIMIFVGRFIDKLGQRSMMVIVGTFLAIACFFNSIVSSMWMLAVGFFLIRLLGQGSMGLLSSTLVVQWFVKKRGLALSIMSLGGFLSAMLFPIINTWIIETYDWQTAWRVWGIALLVIFVPIAFFGVRNKPEEIGLVPDGKEGKEKTKKGLLGIPVVQAEQNWTLKEAMKTRAFWAILVCVGIPGMVNTGITFHIISIFGSNDLSPQIAATVLSLMAVVGIPMTLVSGFLTEKVKTNYLLTAIFVIEIILLFLLIFVTNYSLAIAFGLLWGIAGGLERIGLTIILPNYFGRRYIGSINGFGVTMGVIGSSLGPLPFGVGFDLFNSYTPVLLGILIFPVIGVVCSLIAKKPVKLDGTIETH